MLELQNHFAGTYAKNLLADWVGISDFISQQTTWVKDTIQMQHNPDPLKPPALSDQQINDIFNGPYQQFFKPHLHAYSAIAKIETALAITKDDFFKDAEHVALDKPLGVPESLLTKMESATLKQMREQLNTLTKDHYTQWESNVKNWTTLLLEELKKNNLTLSDIELQDFTINQPVSELHDRFINLKITLPKLDKSAFDFQQYFTLKAILAIQSALNRMQQPRTEKDIEQQLKILQPTLKIMNKTEKELSQAQEKALEQLIVPIKLENCK